MVKLPKFYQPTISILADLLCKTANPSITFFKYFRQAPLKFDLVHAMVVFCPGIIIIYTIVLVVTLIIQSGNFSDSNRAVRNYIPIV